MIIETTRFGPVDVDEQRLLTFREGLLGFPDAQRFALIQTTTDAVFYWMQSLEDPALAFVVCDPRDFVNDYEVPIRTDDLAAIGAADLNDAQVLVIVNKLDGVLTANLLGPLVVSLQSMRARQLVLADRRYTTRHPLVTASATLAVAKSA